VPPCALPAVYSFLLSQKSLGLTDIAKATVTEDSVRLNYVHGIWYQVGFLGEQLVEGSSWWRGAVGGGEQLSLGHDTQACRQLAEVSVPTSQAALNRLLRLPLLSLLLLRCPPSLLCWLT
jgi:hypothetical protein